MWEECGICTWRVSVHLDEHIHQRHKECILLWYSLCLWGSATKIRVDVVIREDIITDMLELFHFNESSVIIGIVELFAKE